MNSIDWSVNCSINTDDILRAEQTALVTGSIYRICFHKDEQKTLHVMLIALPPNATYPAHCHYLKEELYLVYRGGMTLFTYGSKESPNDLDVKEIHIDSNGHCRGYLMHSMVWHSMTAGSCGVVFMEIKTGPFKQNENIYPSR